MKTLGNFILKIFELLKSDPKTTIAKFLIGSGIMLKGIGSITYKYQDKNVQHTFTYVDGLDIVGYILILIGMILLLHRYITIQKYAVSLAYGKGIKNMNIHSPLEAIPTYERFDCISLNIKEINSYDKNETINDYNFNKILLENRIQNKNSKKIYVGALGSFPYLFLLGSLFRNAYSNVEVLDFNRHKNGGKWYKLPLVYEGKKVITHQIISSNNKSIKETITDLNNSENNEVGIALGYTFSTNKNAIPETLEENILFLETSLGTEHDILSSEEVQTKLLKELSNYMASLWNGHEKIHLFVSAQSSMCINIGKMYMDNAHGKLIIYNYDNDSKSYNWSLEFNKGNIT
jgi:hypothetical protein